MKLIDRMLTEAGGILMNHYGRLDGYESKGARNLVTIADRESEECIKRLIRETYPSHRILAEESGAGGGGGDEFCWIVDPLDGTTNFAHNFPVFAVSIGLERHGEIVAGGVFAPHYGERFLAEKGNGATLNGGKIRVSRVGELRDSLTVTGFPYDMRDRSDRLLGYCKEFLASSHGLLRIGSAAMDLCSVACGRLEAFFEESLSPWDTAAGWLIVEEAGGRVSDFSGGAFSPFQGETLATNGRVHGECLLAIGRVREAFGYMVR